MPARLARSLRSSLAEWSGSQIPGRVAGGSRQQALPALSSQFFTRESLLRVPSPESSARSRDGRGLRSAPSLPCAEAPSPGLVSPRAPHSLGLERKACCWVRTWQTPPAWVGFSCPYSLIRTELWSWSPTLPAPWGWASHRPLKGGESPAPFVGLPELSSVHQGEPCLPAGMGASPGPRQPPQSGTTRLCPGEPGPVGSRRGRCSGDRRDKAPADTGGKPRGAGGGPRLPSEAHTPLSPTADGAGTGQANKAKAMGRRLGFG